VLAVFVKTINLVKFIALSAASTARLGLLNTFAKNGNVTDLMNTWNNQNNLAFFIGNLIGLCLSFIMPKSFPVIFGSILLMTVFHLRGTYISVFKTIKMKDYNLQRAYFQARHYMKHRTIASLEDINFKERIFFSNLKYLYFSNYPLEKLLKKNQKETLAHFDIFENEKFTVSVQKKYFGGYKMFVYMRSDAENIDIFFALLYSIRLHDILINYVDIITAMKDNLKYIHEIDKTKLVLAMKNLEWDTVFSKVEEKYMRYQVVN
jgi:hypothetical protein